MYSVFRQAEPTARANVASWANESRECAWTYTGFSSVNSFPAGGLSRSIHRPPPARRGFAGKCRRVGLRIPRMRVDIHRLFLCQFSLCWGALPPHSLASARAVGSRANVIAWAYESREGTWAFTGYSSVSSPSAGGAPPHSLLPALPELFPGGYGFFRRKAFEPTTYSVFRQTEPTARADVASWANESREGAWTFTGFSSVNFPSAEGHCRSIHRLPPAPRVRGQMSPRRPTNPANARGHSAGLSSVNSPSAEGLFRFIHRPPPVLWIRGQMSPRGPTNSANVRKLIPEFSR